MGSLLSEAQVDTKEGEPKVYNPNAEASKKKDVDQVANFVTVALCHPRDIAFRLSSGKSVVINGSSADLRGQTMGVIPTGAFGLTRIPEKEWDEIKQIYSVMPIFANGLIYASTKKSDVIAQANEKADLKHGFEPIKVEGKDKTSLSDKLVNIE